jgi:hypothetical protein
MINYSTLFFYMTEANQVGQEDTANVRPNLSYDANANDESMNLFQSVFQLKRPSIIGKEITEIRE